MYASQFAFGRKQSHAPEMLMVRYFLCLGHLRRIDGGLFAPNENFTDAQFCAKAAPLAERLSLSITINSRKDFLFYKKFT